MKMMKAMKGFSMMIMLAMCFSLTGCYSNPSVPEGNEGYIVENPRVWGKGGFIGTVVGPGNYGASIWNNNAKLVDMRPITYNEQFTILTKDELNVTISWQSVIKAKSGSIKDVIENYGVNYYVSFIQKPLRSKVRGTIQGLDSRDIKDKQTEIIDDVTADINTYLEDTPFQLLSGVLGDIGYPKEVTDAVILKMAEQQKLDAKDTMIKAAAKDAEIRIAQARGIAKAQEIINATLTDQYLQHEAIEAQLKMAESPNHTTVYIPSGANGIPLVKTTR